MVKVGLWGGNSLAAALMSSVGGEVPHRNDGPTAGNVAAADGYWREETLGLRCNDASLPVLRTSGTLLSHRVDTALGTVLRSMP